MVVLEIDHYDQRGDDESNSKTILNLFAGYLFFGGWFFALSFFSYATMWLPMLVQDCGTTATFFALVLGGLIGAVWFLVKVVLWPFGLWSVFTTDLQLLPWLFPGWYAYCG